MVFKLVLALLCAFLVTIFAVQNANPVDVIFYPWQFSVSLAVVILGATLVGAVIVFLLGLVQQIGLGFKLRDYRRQVQDLEEHLEELRAAVATVGPGESEAAELEASEPASGSDHAENGHVASNAIGEDKGEQEQQQEQR